jgi:hypothetical protein
LVEQIAVRFNQPRNTGRMMATLPYITLHELKKQLILISHSGGKSAGAALNLN